MRPLPAVRHTGRLISPASAQTFSSSYTSTAPKDCRSIGKPRDPDGGTTQVCPGKPGLVVVISEDVLRQTVSIGPTSAAATREPAARPGLPHGAVGLAKR